jgi:anti-sigma regulatory factor (Ser/Thr protein kinase)
MKKLTLKATQDNLSKVVEFINRELMQVNCPHKPQSHIIIAVEEIFMNIANYAYEASCGDVTIGIAVGEQTVVRFEDRGKPYDPLLQPAPDLNKPLVEREIGGLGIHMVKQLMDEVSYSYLDNKNILVLTKEIK